MNKQIIFSATNKDEEASRIDRLKDVVAYYKTKISKLNFYKLHDHKGELTVYWSMQPSNEERNAIELAWEEQYELRNNVVHEVE